jgi:hypothetical protein
MFDHEHDHDHDGPEHPKDRPMEDGDPLELHGVALDGDGDLLFTFMVEEFARIGWDAGTILRNFQQPEYQGPYRMLQALGPIESRRRIEQIVQRCGVLRIRAVEAAAEPESPVVGLTVRGHRTIEL